MPKSLSTRDIRKAAERLLRELAAQADEPKFEQESEYVLAIEILADLYRMSEQEAASYAPRVLDAMRLLRNLPVPPAPPASSQWSRRRIVRR
ncbi:hypothetical protein A2851_02750 [Candidatus Kaiserbacteria bacterium RIFCSPHIGHO2_01_FULL_53_29]|uniref:Uncharacterized protein n=1 Tax=Candidatus Kaiserbacteria bacterium RIFCSPHIGHO2_01_FULL_53_29 TaxID=1798480 RepID=A0A1F6CVP3_9BACT|nr:MAG: hypothetical protein A2851_02750 [Candidatus Kaiserbacteria bacterium RIFCSPHIGHO2_01_FULL_53_29]